MPGTGRTIKHLTKLKGPKMYASWCRTIEYAFVSHKIVQTADRHDIEPGLMIKGSGPLTQHGHTGALKADELREPARTIVAAGGTAPTVLTPTETADKNEADSKARRHGEMIAKALMAGLVENGYDVVPGNMRPAAVLPYLSVQFKPDIERDRREILHELRPCHWLTQSQYFRWKPTSMLC